jgi:hypothetical protein
MPAINWTSSCVVVQIHPIRGFRLSIREVRWRAMHEYTQALSKAVKVSLEHPRGAMAGDGMSSPTYSVRQ